MVNSDFINPTSIVYSDNEANKSEHVKPVTKCFIPPRAPVTKLLPVNNSPEIVANLPINKLEIQKITSDQNIPSVGFLVVSHRIQGTTLEILINCLNEIPHVKAFWDEKQSKLYLAGGRLAYLKNEQPLHHIYLNSLLCNEVKQARFSINLDSIGNKKWIQVMKREPALYKWKNRWVEVKKAYEVQLFSIGRPSCQRRLYDFIRMRMASRGQSAIL